MRRNKDSAIAIKAPLFKVTAILAALFVALTISGSTVKVRAQQTFFNVPTTDVLDRGKVYFEMDISVKPNDTDALSHFSSFVPRLVVGTGGNVEVGLNILGNIQPGPDATTLVPAIKWTFYSGKDNGWAMVLGCTSMCRSTTRPTTPGTIPT